MAVPLLPLLLVGIISAFYRKEGHGLVRWRRVLFLTGIVANAVSAALLFTFSVHAYVTAHGTQPFDLGGFYLALSMMIVGLIAAVFGCCGRRVSRMLLVGDGLLTFVFWYFAALATSPNLYRPVEVITNQLPTKYAHDCPQPNETEAPQAINAGDFVELSRSVCFGTCPSYTVRIGIDGDVSWSGRSFVGVVGERRSTIPSDAARALLKRFQSERFWTLCGGYDADITDSPTTQIQVQIGGRGKTVQNYANSAPEWVESFESAIDDAANTHQWRHGEARTEPLSNIFQDGYIPKPGVTPLMKAAAKPDVEAIRRILATGADVDQTDSSGWTALMYAAANEHSEPVELLLASGANPNHKSFTGDTPLMASAIAESFNEPLLHAGADVNAQDAAGMTALMILAADGATNEVRAALKAGAKATLKDGRGRTALDYLHLANCGKSPVPEHRFSLSGKCDHIDNRHLDDVAALLRGATRNPKR